jgi:hypothetical protein
MDALMGPERDERRCPVCGERGTDSIRFRELGDIVGLCACGREKMDAEEDRVAYYASRE